VGDLVEIDNDQSCADQRSTYDARRSRCAVAHEDEGWVILRHAELVAVATDPGTFRAVHGSTRHLQGPPVTELAAYRAVVDRSLTDERVAREAEQYRWHAIAIVDALPRGVTVETIASIGILAISPTASSLPWSLCPSPRSPSPQSCSPCSRRPSAARRASHARQVPRSRTRSGRSRRHTRLARRQRKTSGPGPVVAPRRPQACGQIEEL
jgi:hypothetical protein